MSYTYIAYISINGTDGRSFNFTETPTITVWNGRAKTEIESPSPTLTNIDTGLYAVEIEIATKTDVLFKIVPDTDDEDDIADIKVMHAGYIETVEELADGVTLADGAITAAKIASDAIEAAKIKADAVTKIQNGLATPTNITKVVGAELASTQGAITWGQQKILADKADEGALHIVNAHEDGFGQYNEGGDSGQYNKGELNGQFNIGDSNGQFNRGSTAQHNFGNTIGLRNRGILAEGQKNEGITPVVGYDPAIKTGLALEATLTAIKGAGFDDETLVAIMEAIEAIDPGGGGGLSKADVRDALGMATNNLDTQLSGIKTDTGNVSTRLTATRAGYLDKLNVNGTLANTNNADTFKANVASLALEATAQSIKAKTDNLPASPAGVGAAMTLTSAYDAAKTAASQTSVNAIPTTPLLAGNYTAPDNAGITAIKAKTDNLPASPAPAGEYTSALAGLATSAEVNALNDITAADVLAEEVIGGYSLAQVLTALAAKSHGLASGGGTTTITYKGIDGTPNVVVETVDGKGNRSNVVLNV